MDTAMHTDCRGRMIYYMKSRRIKGDRSNHGWPVQLELFEGGQLRIEQYMDGREGVVLLSSKQLAVLLDFCHQQRIASASRKDR